MTSSRGKAPSQRQLRVGEELRHALATIFERGHFRDPVLTGTTMLGLLKLNLTGPGITESVKSFWRPKA